jgi:hypothetical protein
MVPIANYALGGYCLPHLYSVPEETAPPLTYAVPVTPRHERGYLSEGGNDDILVSAA